MLIGVHVLLTYTCNFECDHCFLYCSPHAEGTFTVAQIRHVLDEAARLGSVTEVYFEGGEPFLYFPLLLEGIRQAGSRGMRTGVVSNCYWATAQEDAELWLSHLCDVGLDTLSLSSDSFHGDGSGRETPAERAAAAAACLQMQAGVICIEAPTISHQRGKGAPVVGGGALLKGRAADTLTEGLSTAPLRNFTECSHEELRSPQRVHVDSFGNVQVCQGISIGNMWEAPLSRLISTYDPESHPVCGPLLRGGPAALAEEHGLPANGSYVDECHACFSLRRALRQRLPDQLAPAQVYGEQSEG